MMHFLETYDEKSDVLPYNISTAIKMITLTPCEEIQGSGYDSRL